MLKTLKVSELEPGMLVSKVVSQHGPVKIRKVGMIRGPEMIKGLTEMGVTEVEVDLSQSLGLLSDNDEELERLNQEAEEPTKLTPTQQLLQNERQSAKASNDVGQQYNRSLFMSSMDNLPSMWELYGKNSALMLLLVVGGVCVGWNIASVPSWLALSSDREYVQIEYQPRSVAVERSQKNAELERPITSQDANDNGQAEQLNAQANSDPVTTAPEAEPIVLGYQPEKLQSREITANTNNDASTKTAEIVNSSSNSESDPAVSAALLEKINQAIANLDSDTGEQDNETPATSYDDLGKPATNQDGTPNTHHVPFDPKKLIIEAITQKKGPPSKKNPSGMYTTVDKEKMKVITKPHGHGDIHNLLYDSGVAKKWRDMGKEWMIFI